MSKLEELIAELKKAEDGSRKLDWAVADYLGDIPKHRVLKPFGWDYGWYRNSESDYALLKPMDCEGRSSQIWQAPQVTCSLDAAVALVNRVLPGFGWDVASNTSHIKACINPEFGKPIGKHPHWAAVSDTSSKKFEDGTTPAIALCIATLRAKLAQEEA